MLQALLAFLIFQNPYVKEHTRNIGVVINEEYTEIIRNYYPVPAESEMTYQIFPAPKQTLSNEFDLLVWNIWKAQDPKNLTRELPLLSAGRELVLLQEGITNSNLLPSLANQKKQGWIMAKSFSFGSTGEVTGVISGSTAEPESAIAIRSPDVEPLGATPKMSLATIYRLENGERLLVINIHGINFVANSAFRRHIDQLTPWLKNFKGKALFAGDFNTWNPGRKKYLDQAMRAAGFSHAQFAHDRRWIHLDHIFVRGCKIESGNIHEWSEASDHWPITARINCN